MRKPPWILFLASGVVATCAAAVLGPGVQAGSALLLGIAASSAGFVTARRNPGPVRETWTLYGLAGAGFVVAGVIRAATSALSAHGPAFPAPADGDRCTCLHRPSSWGHTGWAASGLRAGTGPHT